jgi:SAM-dependent methyltransferase
MKTPHALIDRISPAYLDMQKVLHAAPDGYGGKGKKWADTVEALLQHFDAHSVLDYGCGGGTLVATLKDRYLTGVRLDEYDPARPGKDSLPAFADLVVCTDVLEHIEPEKLPAVLAHLHVLARQAVLFVIALDPANKTLTDGRNAHLILESREWWLDQLTAARFRLLDWKSWPLPLPYKRAEKREKRVIAVGVPC